MSPFSLVLLFVSVGAVVGFPTWMSGTWGATVDGVRMEEHWTGAEGDLMLGLHRDVRPSGKTSFEFLRIERRGERLVYVAQPGGRAPTLFPLESAEANRITFANPEHDFPQRIEYRLEEGRLCARVSGTVGGATKSEEWCWSSVATRSSRK